MLIIEIKMALLSIDVLIVRELGKLPLQAVGRIPSDVKFAAIFYKEY